MRRWLPSWPDAVLALALLVAVEVELWAITLAGPVTLWAASIGAGCLAVAFRRTAPLTATAVSLSALMVVTALEGFDEAATFGWLIVALLMSASCGYHAARPYLGLAIVLATSATAIIIEHGVDFAELLYPWILAGGAWLAGRALRSQAAATELATEHAQLVEERTRMLADRAVAEERLRIAREMHDVVAHSLSVMLLHVGGVRRLLRADQSAERDALCDAERAGREATAEMHRILGVLRDDGSAPPGPAPSLSRLDELIALARGAGLRVELETEGTSPELPPGVGLAGFRVVQEALTNVLRHARASRVDVAVRYRPGAVDIEVRDDGVGPTGPGSHGKAHGHGLVGMTERVAAYGGTLDVGSGPTGGYRVRATLPLLAAAPAVLEAPLGEPGPA